MRKLLVIFAAAALLATSYTALPVSAAERLEIEAEKISAAPVIDGTITEAEWGEPFFSGKPLENRDAIYISDTVKEDLVPTDLKLYVRWDDTNLYIGAIVEETVFWNTHTDMNCWYADSLQLDVCISDSNQDVRWRTNTAFSTSNNQTYSYVFNAPDAAMTGLTGSNAARDSAPDGAGESAVTLNGNTVTYELTFPWAYYGAGAEIKEGHSRLINFQFYLADGSLAPNGTSFPGTTYLGSIRYGNAADDGSTGQYPLVTLVNGNGSTASSGSDTVSDTESDTGSSSQSDNKSSVPDSSSADAPSGGNDDGGDLPLGVILGAAAAVIVIAAVIIAVILKKKK